MHAVGCGSAGPAAPEVEHPAGAGRRSGLASASRRIEVAVKRLGHEVRLQAGKQLPCALVGVSSASIAIVGEPDGDVDHGAATMPGTSGFARRPSSRRIAGPRGTRWGGRLSWRQDTACFVICSCSLPSSVATISAWWSDTNPRSFSIVTASGTAVTRVSSSTRVEGLRLEPAAPPRVAASLCRRAGCRFPVGRPDCARFPWPAAAPDRLDAAWSRACRRPGSR